MFALREKYSSQIDEYLHSDRNPFNQFTPEQRREMGKKIWEKTINGDHWTRTTPFQEILTDHMKMTGIEFKVEQRIVMEDGQTPKFYVPDIVVYQKKLIIEVDGWVHHRRKEYDQRRTERLQAQGWSVMRFWNSEVQKNTDECVKKILSEMDRL